MYLNVRLFCGLSEEAFKSCELAKRDDSAKEDAEEHRDSSALDAADDSEEADKEDEGKCGLFKLHRNGAGKHADNGANKCDEPVTEAVRGDSVFSFCVSSVACIFKICVHFNTSVISVLEKCRFAKFAAFS